jgi:alpha-tubulin suppressor-like RCC1 family protein
MLWIGITPTVAQGSPTTRTTEFVLKVVGTQHFLALIADGSVVGRGRHRDGQLGEQAMLNTSRLFGVAAPLAGASEHGKFQP